jgi:DNA-methyltransferase (dcm)
MDYSIVKEKRLEYGISQIKLAKYCGLSPATISSWELGKTIPTASQLDSITIALKELIYSIENKGLNIKKKKIQHSKNTEKKLPSKIRTVEEYNILLNHIKTKPTDYKRTLSNLYKNFLSEKADFAPKAISLFSGCGGLDLGFAAAGFNIVGHIEIEPSAREIYEVNFKESKLLGVDVCDVTDRDIDDWKKQFGNIDILIGGPPCQGFSLAGKRNPDDIRNQLYKYYVKLVTAIRPRVFVMENVRLLTSMKTSDGALFIDNIVEEFRTAGYSIAINEINAQDYGVPQSRERVIIIGIRTDINTNNFVFPCPTYLKENIQLTLEENIKCHRTFRDATEDLQNIESGETSSDPLHWSIVHPDHVIEWLKNVPEGCSAHENEDPKLRPSSGFNTTYKRIVWDEPCSTISTNFSMISGCRNVHPSATRSLTIREATRAQSFPDEFVFVGKWGDIRKAIGNAVPPILAKVIADSIMEQLF